jgi:hypothetical protein
MRANNIAELRPLIGLALRMELGPWKAECIDGISHEVHVRAGNVIFIFKVDEAKIEYLEPGQEVHVNIATGKLTRVRH